MNDWDSLVKNNKAFTTIELSLEDLNRKWDFGKKLLLLKYMEKVMDCLVAYHHARVTHDWFTGDCNEPSKRAALISLSIVVDKLLDVKPGARPDFSPITTDSTFQDTLLQNAMSVSTMCLQRVQCVYYSLVTDYVGTLYHVQHSDFCVWPTTFLPEGQSEQANN